MAAVDAGELRSWPVFRLGFRPFYLGAATFAMLAIPAWIGALLYGTSLGLSMPPVLWHAHDMLFGFAAAVIVGFLLTAGRAWTGLDTPRGPLLASLAGLWLAARVTAVTGPYPVYAALDLLLLPCIAVIRDDQGDGACGRAEALCRARLRCSVRHEPRPARRVHARRSRHQARVSNPQMGSDPGV